MLQWFWTVCSYGYSRWLYWPERLGLYCKHRHSTIIVYRSIESVPNTSRALHRLVDVLNNNNKQKNKL